MAGASFRADNPDTLAKSYSQAAEYFGIEQEAVHNVDLQAVNEASQAERRFADDMQPAGVAQLCRQWHMPRQDGNTGIDAMLAEAIGERHDLAFGATIAEIADDQQHLHAGVRVGLHGLWLRWDTAVSHR